MVSSHINCLGKTCWKSVQEAQLSKNIHFSVDNAMLDAIVANDLIVDIQHLKIIGDIKQHSTDLSTVTHWLLTEALPLSGYLGFTKFCCLLRAKSSLSDIQINLCNECKVSLSKCQTSDSVIFKVDSSCKAFLETLQSSIHTDHVKVAGMPVILKDINKKTKWDPVVSTKSIVCINNEITATLTISTTESHFYWQIFMQNIIAHLNVEASEVHMPLSAKTDTWMILRLSTRAGLNLLSILRSTDLKQRFNRAITKAWSSKSESATRVFIETRISDLSLTTTDLVVPGQMPIPRGEL